MGTISNQIGEVTLIGTGGGYGESCVIHLGNQNWAVVDSCIDPISKRSLSLQYLLDSGVNIETEVKLIICTHWHDDHILGLSQLLERSNECEFVMAEVHDLLKFLSFVSLDYKKARYNSSISSTLEFNKCIDIINNRGNRLGLACENKILYTIQVGSNRSEVISLSPSDFIILEFDKEISTLITEYGVSNKKIVYHSPNSKSVCLFLKLGSHRVLLGSDLESSTDHRMGWLNVIEHNKVIDKKSNLFKVPHHGSQNGFDERIWLELLEKDSIFKLSPFNRGKALPEQEMIKKMLTFTNNLYMTSPVRANKKPKKRDDHGIAKFIEKTRPSLEEIKYSYGAVRCQVDLSSSISNWEITKIGEAINISL